MAALEIQLSNRSVAIVVAAPRGCGGIGRRARFRSVWGKPRGGSSPLIRTSPLGWRKASAVPRPANGAAAPIGAPQTGGCVISPSLALRTPEDRRRGRSPATGTEAALRGGDGPHPPPFLIR